MTAVTQKQLTVVQNTQLAFSRESFANMQKFARFFGLESILKASNEQALTKIWHESISANLKKNILEAQTGIDED